MTQIHDENKWKPSYFKLLDSSTVYCLLISMSVVDTSTGYGNLQTPVSWFWHAQVGTENQHTFEITNQLFATCPCKIGMSTWRVQVTHLPHVFPHEMGYETDYMVVPLNQELNVASIFLQLRCKVCSGAVAKSIVCSQQHKKTHHPLTVVLGPVEGALEI